MTIVPDTKNWTWVPGTPCPECGFRASSFAREEIPARLRANADAWRAVFAGPGGLRVRPRPDKWSPLEYGCHVRDVFRLYAFRLELMLTEDDPAYPNWAAEQGQAVAQHFRAVSLQQPASPGSRSSPLVGHAADLTGQQQQQPLPEVPRHTAATVRLLGTFVSHSSQAFVTLCSDRRGAVPRWAGPAARTTPKALEPDHSDGAVAASPR